MQAEEEHTIKWSSQYRNTGILRRSLSFGRRVKSTKTHTSVVTVESILYKRSGWKYAAHMFSLRDGDLCYRDDDGFINCGKVISSVSTREGLLEFNIYTTQREYRMRALDSATFTLWLANCHIDE